MRKNILYIILILFASCQLRQVPNSMQELNFEVFWQTFEDNYAFFELKGVNWNETYSKYRNQITSQTTDDELFQILSDMVRPLKDGHIHIEANDDNYFNDGGTGRFRKEFNNDSLVNEYWKMVHSTLKTNSFGKVDSIGFELDGEKLFHYAKSKDYGYFRFLRSNPTGEPYTSPDLIQIRNDLNVIFENFKDLKGMIIDVRLHRGGFPQFSYEIAGRFTNKKTLGHYAQSRISSQGYEDFDGLTATFIEPKQYYATEKFLKPVIILSNGEVGSAGELFVLAMKQLPNVRILGENTKGILSFMYEFNLPNGWWVSLSNQRVYSPTMELYEGKGIPVDIEILNTQKDLAKMTDPLILRAIKELRKE